MPIDTPEAIAVARAAQHRRQRAGRDLRVEIPRGHLDGALAMLWVRTRFIAGNTSRGCSNSRPTTSGARNSRDDVPHGLGRLAAVVGMGLGDRFAPPLVPSPSMRDQDELAVVQRPKLVSKK